MLTHVNPSLVGIVADKNTILNEIKKDNRSIKIIPTDPDSHHELIEVAAVSAGHETLYGKYVLPSIPGFLVIPMRNSPYGALLIDNALVVSSLSSPQFTSASPIVAYQFVKQYFQTLYIKSYPKFSILNSDEYVSYRKSDSRKKIAQIDNQLQKLESSVSSTSASIQKDKDAISSSQDLLQQTQNLQSLLTKKCNSTHVYHTGTIYDSYPKSACKGLLSDLDNKITQLTKNIASQNNKLKSDQNALTDDALYKTIFNAQKAALSNLQKNLPFERGVFEPPTSVKMLLDTKDAHAVSDYLETLTHEYLHYASYHKGKALEEIFFEEGLTEYFARQVIQYNLHIDTNVAYPIHVKIIEALTNRIPETALAHIYFEKDQKKLEETLDQVYGDGFYENNRILFETIHFSSSPVQVIQLANTLMKRIGGSPLSQKDLYSSKSSL